MKKKEKKIISITVSVIVVAVIGGIIYYYNIQTLPEDMKTQWISSGPFAIDKPKYKLGENVFLVVSNLQPGEVGLISFIAPNGVAYKEIPFNGTLKDHFSFYFTPTTSGIKKFYKADDLVGTWNVVFVGVPYKSINFQIINEYIYGGEANVPPVPQTNETSG